jgi:GTP-binding protein Era
MINSRCGYVAIVGRPNVGKSTLLNSILGQKLSITSHKPQTTRHQILGIKTENNIQTLYVDTPGIHRGGQHAINRYMNRAALSTLSDVDIIGFMVDANRWTAEDEWILNKLKKNSRPVILIVNKVDKIHPKKLLIPVLETLSKKMDFLEIVPLSAKNGENVAALESVFANLLPENPHFFPEDQITDRSDRFLASEIIREKITRLLHQELPYATTIEIEQFKEVEKNNKKVLHIHAVIWLERAGQKAILIGEGGNQLKVVGERARFDMEKLFSEKVFLKLWVKIKENWSDDERALRSLGYES